MITTVALAVLAAGPLRMNLDDAVKLALERNPGIARAHKEADLARAQAREILGESLPHLSLEGQAFHTNYLPDFKATGMYAYTPVVELDPVTGLPKIDPSTGRPIPAPYAVPQPILEISNNREGTVYAGKALLTMPLFAGGRVFYGYRGAAANREAAEERVRAVENRVVLDVTRAFYGGLLADAVVSAREEGRSLALEHQVRVQALYNKGMVSSQEILRAQVQVEGIEPGLIRARAMAHLARQRLLALLDMAGEDMVLAGKLEYVPGSHKPGCDEHEAAKDRPDLKDLRLLTEIAGMSRKASRGAFLPQVGLFAQYETNRGGFFPPLDRQWVSGYTAGISVNIPLFNGFSDQARLAQARATEEGLALGVRELEAAISLQVRTAASTLKAAEEAMAAERRAVDLAAQNLSAAGRRYGAGQATHLDVLDAQTELTRARVGYAQAVHDALVAGAELEEACGKY